MSISDPTFVGHVDSVKGAVVTVRLREQLPTLVMVDGQSYRIGQIGAFLRVPLGYTQLYAVCTLVGSAAAPQAESLDLHPGRNWISMTLFGEAVGDYFQRGVSQYPTIDDEVHLVTLRDINIIYRATDVERAITVGHIAASSGIIGRLDLGPLVTRHSAIVGSTGAGKTNLIAVLLGAIASHGYQSARVLVIDPHGEYASAIGEHGYVFKVNPNEEKNERPLYVPFWALPFDELRQITLGDMQPAPESAIRDIITERKKAAALHLTSPPPDTAITADSPIPFSINQLWFDLDDFERQTFNKSQGEDLCDVEQSGDPEKLESNIYPKASLGSKAPFKNPRPRNITKQLELMKSRLLDSRFNFLFEPGDQLTPNLEGKINGDLDTMVESWIGHDRPITVLDVSGLPSEALSTIVGTLLRIVYDMLFWALDLPISGRKQPLLVVLEEAHLFLPEGGDSPAHRTVSKIAKEGRKYGVGLCVVTQRPGEIESTVLSQCGTMIALRLTNTQDRSKVEAAMPDDLGALSAMLPSLRTGEGLVIGEAMPIPSRIQFYKAGAKPVGDDPDVPSAWRQERPEGEHYFQALINWRGQSDLSIKEDSDG
ncbi:MAG: ATP-binding protein [Chloroflexi bacterium]|nr:ATP-binding protein [Chloroflexota bacterium]